MDATQEATAAVVRAAEKTKEPTAASDRVELSTGVVLGLREVPQLMIADLLGQFERPKPPTVFIEEKGRREENPNDPDYLSRVQSYEAVLAKALNDFLIVKGTYLVSIPEGVAKIEDESWAEESAVLGLSVPRHPLARYLMWIKQVAAVKDVDVAKIIEGVGRVTGVSEKDVKDAINRFQRR